MSRRSPAAAPPPTDAALAAWVRAQRWFGGGTPDAAVGPGRRGEAAPAVARHPLPTDPPLTVAVVDVDGAAYQLLQLDRPARGASPAAPAPSAPDDADDPVAADALARFVAAGPTGPGAGAAVHGHWLGGPPAGDLPARALGADQSNTSVVVGGTHVLKVLRRVRPGIHPEVEVGRHLAAVTAADPDLVLPVAPLSGWWELAPGDDAAGPAADPARTPATTVLGVVHELVPGALDGWSLVLSALAADPGGLLERLHDLGRATAVLHDALARPAATPAPGADRVAGHPDPAAFGTVPLSAADVDAVVGGVVDAVDRLAGATDPALPPDLARRVVDHARSCAASLGDDGGRLALGPAIRDHGDLHLGQTVVGPDGWVVLDFEGEPARPLDERRRRHSPLRDVAGLLRSLSYAAATVRRSGTHLGAGWEPAARAAVLDGYLATVDPALLPPSAVTVRSLVELFELEKAVYEVGYEVAHRPDWVDLPVSGLVRLTTTGGGRP